MNFNAYHIFKVAEGEVDYAHRTVTPCEDIPGMPIENYDTRLTVTGLRESDFAVFAEVDGRPLDYLAVEHNREFTELVNSTLVLLSPADFVTKSLARMLRSAPRTEFDQFSIDPVFDYLDKAFPKAK